MGHRPVYTNNRRYPYYHRKWALIQCEITYNIRTIIGHRPLYTEIRDNIHTIMTI